MHFRTRLTLTVLLALVMSLPGGRVAAQVQLPSLGDRLSGFVSLDDEYRLGRSLLRQVRRSSPTLDDPLINNYVVNVTHQLAVHSELQDHRLAFVVIDSPVLNAFAAPGGVIGVNAGLFLNAHTEGEFASVLAHELAHVSQRHFARSVEESQRQRVPQLATLLASIVVMATSDASTGQAAMMAAQGRAVENQLRFSRSNEAEADRVGIRTLYNAGYDPGAMPALFERLMEIGRYGRQQPEFLLSHPVTASRVADTRGRASRYPDRAVGSQLDYQLMRARVQVRYESKPEDAIQLFERQLETSKDATVRDGSRYGLALAYLADERYREAHDTLAPLLEKDPNRIAYVVTRAEILTAENEPAMAQNFLDRHMAINPANHPLTMAYAEALIAARDYKKAVEVLENHAKRRPEDHSLWYTIAETQGLAGDISKVHQARAEYFILVGDFRSAHEQLSYAIRLEAEKENNGPLQARLRQRLNEVETLRRQEQA